MTEVDVNPLPIGEFRLRSSVELGDSQGHHVSASVHAADGAWTLVETSRFGCAPGELHVVLVRVTGRR